MAITNKISNPQQLDLFQVQAEYPKEIVQNSSQEIDLDDLDISKNVLICNVKKDNVRHFLDGTAKIYYTGKEFPSTIALNKLYYFMPFFGFGVESPLMRLRERERTLFSGMRPRLPVPRLISVSSRA